MTGKLKFYDADQVAITFAGILVNSGYDDGEFCAVERNEDTFVVKIGTDGEGTRSKTNNKSGRVTIKLMQTAETNQKFSALHAKDEQNPNGAGVGTLRITDLQSPGRETLYKSQAAWLVKPATATFDRDPTAREWVIETHCLEMFTAGN